MAGKAAESLVWQGSKKQRANRYGGEPRTLLSFFIVPSALLLEDVLQLQSISRKHHPLTQALSGGSWDGYFHPLTLKTLL